MKKILFGIMAILTAISLCACTDDTEKEPVNQEQTSNIENVTINEVEENTSSKQTLSDEAMYGTIINDYNSALTELKSGDYEFEDEILQKYDNLSDVLAFHINRYAKDGVTLTHTYYDIDNNGVNELLVGASGSVGAIYSYDLLNNKPVLVFSQSTMERGDLSIYDNGILLSAGAGGAALHYFEYGRIAKDGISYELLENVEEEYVEGEEKPVYKDATTGEKLDYTSIDEVNNKYVAGASELKF